MDKFELRELILYKMTDEYYLKKIKEESKYYYEDIINPKLFRISMDKELDDQVFEAIEEYNINTVNCEK